MEALKFTLGGKTAFFKKPDVNTYYYFTYGNIHKVAVLGILGAILGLNGYSFQQGRRYPEFYEELKDIEVSIVPLNSEGVFSKSFQTFNNSVGYASKEDGGNLIVKEQWLESPQWDIYILSENNKYFDKMKDHLLNSKCVFIPYLGKNDHPANISKVEYIKELGNRKDYSNIASLFPSDLFQIQIGVDEISNNNWKYEESLPIALDETTNQYVLNRMVLTNNKILANEDANIYAHEEKNLYFI